MSHKVNNIVQSALLLGGMSLLLVLMGWLIAGWFGVAFAVVGVILLLLSPQVSPHFIFRLYRAHRLTTYEAPVLLGILHELAQRAELPHTPHLYYIPSSIVNAFAVGRHAEAAIGVTDGMLRRLNRRELVGVLAHEISHVRNYDTWVMGLALFVTLPLMLLGHYTSPWMLILLLIFAPTLSALLQLALSRTREFDADLDAAVLTGDPAGLAAALAKLERYQRGFMERILLPGRQIPDPSLLRTHPKTEERIERLLAFAEELAPRRPSPLPLPEEVLRYTMQAPQIIRVPSWHFSRLWH
jgi:heat shock protein HtpX